jgi:hypothetical protein
MFESKPILPVAPNDQPWIEESFDWLLNEFGKDHFLQRQTILPTASFFPDKYRGTEECALLVVRRTCESLSVPPDPWVHRDIADEFFFLWPETLDRLLDFFFFGKDGFRRDLFVCNPETLRAVCNLRFRPYPNGSVSPGRRAFMSSGRKRRAFCQPGMNRHNCRKRLARRSASAALVSS